MNFITLIQIILFTLVVYFLIIPTSFSQILNIEKDRQEMEAKDTTFWRGNFVLAFDLTKQQNTVLQFDNDDYLLLSTPKHAYMWIGHINLLKSQGENVISEGYFHHRINFWKDKKLSYEVFAQYQYNETRGLRNRGLFGATPRLTLKASKKVDIAIGTGVMYEWEEWKLEDEQALTRLFKSTNYLNIHTKLTENTEFIFITYFQARFDGFFYPRISGDANIRIQLSKAISFNFHYTPYFDAEPVIPIYKWNYELTSGLGIQF